MADHEKLVIMVTHGPEDPELATIPFAMAGAAVASDVEVVLGFQGEGCLLVKKGVAETVAAPEFAPLGGLLEAVRELGAQLLVCSPCVKSRAPERGRPRRGDGDRRSGTLRRRDQLGHQQPRLLRRSR